MQESESACWCLQRRRLALVLKFNYLNLLSVFPSDLIRWVLAQFVLAKLHVSSVKGEVAADQRITKADNQLDGLDCLDAADDSRKDS